MLCLIGSIQVEIAPFGLTDTEHKAGASYAAHDVVGRMPPLEFVGEAPESWTHRGTLFPKKFAELGFGSGLDELATLHAMRRSGMAQFYMRGDGTPMGWVVITDVTERSSRLAADGVGRIIAFDIELKRSDPPGADGMFSALIGLFS